MTIESKFESVYDIPLGGIVVDVVAVDSGEVTPVTLDAQGLGTFKGRRASPIGCMSRARCLPGTSRACFLPTMA